MGSVWPLAALVLPILISETPSAPVLAVFPIQDSAGKLPAKALGQLTDYLGAKIAETGRFVLVPQKELTQILKDKKSDSYKVCIDQACQIEIGKELAAQKVLQTQIIQAGDQCAVTATIYDLRIAATEKAVVHKGGCTENAIVESLEQVATKLGAGVSIAPKPQEIATPEAKPPPLEPSTPKFTLRVEAEPSDADVLVDGRTIGKGQARVDLEPNTPHALLIRREGYVEHRSDVQLEHDDSLRVELPMTEEYRLARREVIGISAAGDITPGGTIGGGLWLRGPTIPFNGFVWATAEVLFGLAKSSRVEPCINDMAAFVDCKPGSTLLTFAAVTRAGYRLSFGDSDALELTIGAGLLIRSDISQGAGLPAAGGAYSGPVVMPALRYLHTSGGIDYGAGVRVLLPVAEIGKSCPLQPPVASYIACGESKPLMIELEVPLGLLY